MPYTPISYNWRRGSESNRRMGLLQSPALPLGYPAVWEKIVFQERRRSESNRLIGLLQSPAFPLGNSAVS